MINSKEQIIEYFKSGIKKTQDFKIGVEHEKFLFNNHNNKRIDYSKVKEMFSTLLEFGWNPILEKENIIGLNKGGKNITLEPGNQIELSGDKLNHVHEACAESQDYLFELRQVTKKLDIKIVSAGFDPISKLDEVPNNPKQRYELMTKDMPLGGELSLDMMYRTCGTQLNIDYNSEKDFMDGKIDEIGNRLPTENDLTTHLSTIFTENRLKKYIELRSMDTCGWDCLCSGPPFNIGMLYGTLDETYELISNWDKDKILNAYLEAPKKGFNTQLMGKDLLYWASTLLDLSRKGLEKRDILNKHEKNETLFLNHLQKVIDNKTTNADHMISKFSKSENLNELYDK